jgi:5-aminolevulinate synthase
MQNSLIRPDASNHNSMIEGIRQSGSGKQTGRHDDVAHLDELLAASDPHRPKLIVFEGQYPMGGDVAPIQRICDLAARYGAVIAQSTPAGAAVRVRIESGLLGEQSRGRA